SINFVGDKEENDADACEGGLVVLNVKPSAAMLDEATAREVCAKIQKMRKEAGLRKEDKVRGMGGWWDDWWERSKGGRKASW
ncbi:MAG: hypothetical protein SGPRY_004708, partial [Prymnesium sp.]